MASSIPQIRYFRFCPICLQDDIKSYGEPYWHRIHQIAGILICPTHQVLLQNSSIKTQGENRHEFYPADIENCLYKPYLFEFEKDDLEKLFELAKNIENLLSSALSSQKGEVFRRKYLSLLIEKGLATASGRVYQKDLTNEFVNFYGKRFLQLVHCDINPENQNNWLSSIVRKHRKSFHPLRHLLFIRFLRHDISLFFEREEGNQHQFGEAPWTCFNGATKHYLQKTVESVSISYSHDSKKLVGTFCCKCGFVYLSSNPSIPNGKKLIYAKIKSFGKIWDRKLKQLLVDKKTSFREAGRRLKVDTNTIINNAKRLKLIKEENTDENAQRKISSSKSLLGNRKKYRKKWIETRRKNISFSKTELRKKIPKICIWLYRNDRNWLEINSPSKKRVISQKQIIDWIKRDEKICSQTQQIIEELLRQTPLTRITINAVATRLGLRSLIQKHLDKLPRTKALLEYMSESIEQFRCRRIHRAISVLMMRKGNVKNWEVVRFAGLGKTAAKQFDEIISREIEAFYCKNLHRKVFKIG